MIGLFSFIGGIIGGGAQKKASQKATDAQVAAYNRGIDTQNAQYQQTRTDYMPYTQAGTSALGGLSELLGLGGGSEAGALGGSDAQQAAIKHLKASPLYTSQFDNGRDVLLANASASGGLRGGDFQRSSMDFGADVLANVYQQQIGNLGSVAGMGLGATGSVAGFGAQKASNVSNLLGDIGKAQATNFLTKGGINAANWNNAGSFLDQAVSAGLPTGGSGGGGGFSFNSALKSIFG